MKKHWRYSSSRLSEPGHHTIGFHTPRAPSHKAWAAKCWVAVLALAVAVLLLGQACLLLQNSATARSSVVFSLVRQKGGITGSPGAVDVGHLALLDTLWSALPFTRAVHQKGHSSSIWGHTSANSSPSFSNKRSEQLQQGDEQAGAVQGSISAAEPLDSLSDSSSSSGLQFPALTQLRSRSHPEVGLLHRLSAAALSSGLSAAEAREAYLASFQAVPPPKGFPAWQVKLPPSPEAAAAAEAAEHQHQHKGARYISLDEPESDTISNVTAADFLKARPKGRTLADEAGITAAAAAATAFLAQTAAAPPPGAVPHGRTHLQGTQAEQEGAQQQDQQDQHQQQEASLQGRKAAEHLMKYALLLIKATHKVAPCAIDDASLPIDKLMGGPHAPKVLLAVTGTAEGTEALPNLVLQLLQFVLQSRPGSLYISMVEGDTATSSKQHQQSSTSTGDAAAYLDMLQLLLLPLRVPLMVVQADLPTHLEAQQHKHILHAAARNTAIEPFFGNVGFLNTDLSSCRTEGTEQDEDSTEAESGDDEQEQDGPMASTVDIGSGISLDQSLVDDGLSEARDMSSMRAGLGVDAEAGASALAELSAPVPTVVYKQQQQARRSAGSWLLGGRSRPSRSVLSRGSFAFDFVSAGAQDDRTAPTAADKPSSSDYVHDSAAASSRESNEQASAASDLNQPQRSLQPHSRPECFNPDWVLFIEASSFFCKSDVQRLLMHTDADLTCGMDMHVAEPSSNANSAGQPAAADSQQGTPAAEVVESIRRQLLQEHQHHNPSQHNQQQQQEEVERIVGQQDSIPAPGSTELADWQLPQQQQKLLQHQRHMQAEAAKPMDVQQGTGPVPTAVTAASHVWAERPPALDIWKHPVVYAGASVGRMVNGVPFSAAPYYAAGHAPTLRRLVAGLPVQVHCCWSGLAKLSAEPFKRGLQFRAHPMHGECRAPSQNLMCDDLHRTGFNRVMIDAGVLLTRDLDVSVKFTPLIRAADRAPFVRRSRWVEVMGSGSAWELDSSSLRQSYKAIQCCMEPQKQQQQLVVDEMVAAAAASSRVGEPLPLRGWDAQGCRVMDVLASNHTATFLQSIGLALGA